SEIGEQPVSIFVRFAVVSQGEKMNLPLPLLRLARGPDQDQAVKHRSERLRLPDHEQARHDVSSRQAGVGMSWHAVDIVRDKQQSVLSGESENLRIWPLAQTHFPSADEFQAGFASQDAINDVLIQIVVSEEARAAHVPSDTLAFLSARSRSAAGLGRCSLRARSCAQTASCRCR